MSQEINKTIVLNQHKFLEFKAFNEASQYESIYVNNDSTLVFPILPGEVIPTHGVFFEIPVWIEKFANVKSIALVGLYVYDLPEEISKLSKLESIALALPKDVDLDKIISRIKSIKSLKSLLLVNLAINDKQVEVLETSLPGISVIDPLKAMRLNKPDIK